MIACPLLIIIFLMYVYIFEQLKQLCAYIHNNYNVLLNIRSQIYRMVLTIIFS